MGGIVVDICHATELLKETLTRVFDSPMDMLMRAQVTMLVMIIVVLRAASKERDAWVVLLAAAPAGAARRSV